jgi:hypothetical protein
MCCWKKRHVILALAAALTIGITLGAEQAVLPTSMCGDFFIAEVSINGQGPWPMVLDTGAGTMVLSKRIAGPLATGDRVQTVDIGSFHAEGTIPVITRSMDQLSQALGTRIEGIVGHPVFQRVLLTYDYPAGEVRIESGSLPADGPGIVPTGKKSRPYVGSRIGGRRFNVLIDTGSGSGLSLSRAKRYRFSEPLRWIGTRVKINGLFYRSAGRLQGSVQLGPLTLKEPIVNDWVRKGRHDNVVGQEILRNFVLTFDQQNRVMQFGGPVDEPLRFDSKYGIGAVFTPGERGWPLLEIFPGSGAEAAGLQHGDVLLARDGEPMWDRSCREDASYDTAPKEVTLTVRRNDQEVDLTVTTRILVP